jgi:UDP-N-acetylmuramyl pentapeptide phosphotransferase/UDP-N-acetylglucosamine-1-phosphate transferase
MATIFIISFIISALAHAVIIRLTTRYALFIDNDQKPQKVHTLPVPRAGGIGIFIALIPLISNSFGFELLPSVFLAFLSGIFEDLHSSLSPKVRILLQSIAAITAIWLCDSVISYLGLGIELAYPLAVLFSIFAIVGMTNAVNIIDGFNGLASGTVIIILLSFAYIAQIHENTELLATIIIILGATIGFFIFVFPFGKIFLGDGGAYMLGFIVSIIGIHLAGNYKDVSPWYVLAVFIYPVWEVIFSIIRKTLKGTSPMQPDRYHLHMLIYRNITKNNPLTALLIISGIIPFIVYATLHAHCSVCNIKAAMLFIVCYNILFWFLIKHEKNIQKTK